MGCSQIPPSCSRTQVRSLSTPQFDRHSSSCKNTNPSFFSFFSAPHMQRIICFSTPQLILHPELTGQFRSSRFFRSSNPKLPRNFVRVAYATTRGSSAPLTKSQWRGDMRFIFVSSRWDAGLFLSCSRDKGLWGRSRSWILFRAFPFFGQIQVAMYL